MELKHLKQHEVEGWWEPKTKIDKIILQRITGLDDPVIIHLEGAVAFDKRIEFELNPPLREK